MKNGKAVALVTAGLVAGLVLGSLAIASAAPPADAAAGEAPGFGARMGMAMRDAGARMIDVVADLTGLEVDEVHDRRADGESIATIAQSEGVETSALVDEALSARKAILDQKVAEGTIDAETAEAMLERMSERITERLDSTETGPFGPRAGAGCAGGACGEGGVARGGRRGGPGGGGPGGMGLRDGSCIAP